jgi:hypothetical protein
LFGRFTNDLAELAKNCMYVYYIKMTVRFNADILHNPFVKYLVLLVAIGNFILFVLSRNVVSIGVFLISAIFAAFYSKNMVVILVVALVICNIICVSSGNIEGFANPPPTLPPPMQNVVNDISNISDKMTSTNEAIKKKTS